MSRTGVAHASERRAGERIHRHHADEAPDRDQILGHLDNGLGYYRFRYNGSEKVYVGVMAQEVQSVRPEAVMRGHDGYLSVNYDMLGLRRMTWDQWVASGGKIPAPTTRH